MRIQPSCVTTDLAIETIPAKADSDVSGIRTVTRQENGIGITEMEILTPEGEQKTGRGMGVYYSLDIGQIWYASREQQHRTAHSIAHYCRQLLPDKNDQNENRILVAGLGNRSITADCLGPKTADNLNVTRHLKDPQPNLYRQLAGSEVSAITPGVSGQTGMETTDILRAVAAIIQPDCIIAIDALAARSTDRLGTTVQITNTGISPGSGIGNHRTAVNAQTIGIPVIGLGVPTVVSSSTLVYDALEKAGIDRIDDRLHQLLHNGNHFFVSLKESDIAVHTLSKVLAQALNIALGNDYE